MGLQWSNYVQLITIIYVQFITIQISKLLRDKSSTFFYTNHPSTKTCQGAASLQPPNRFSFVHQDLHR